MQRRLSATALFISGVVACPCHLVVTLPLALSLLAGTAVGAWLGSHQSLVFTFASVYFIAALSLGYWLWFLPAAHSRRAESRQSDICSSCPPEPANVPASSNQPTEVV